MDKATKQEALVRTQQIMQMRAKGFRPYHIVQFTAKEWGIAKRQTYQYIKWADARLRRQTEKEEKKILVSVKTYLFNLLSEAQVDKDGHLARLIIKDIRDLYGIDAPKELNVGVTLKSFDDIVQERRSERGLEIKGNGKLQIEGAKDE